MVERGLKMSAKAIYDMDSPGAGVADAVVSLGGRYSGAFVSDKGLFLTSGIPAAAFIGRLGDAGKDLLKDGFWAASEQHEIPVPGSRHTVPSNQKSALPVRTLILLHTK